MCSDVCVLIPDLGYVTIHMSLLLNEKLAISSILPLQKGGSRTPWYSKYLLSYSIGVLGVSTSLSAIVLNGYNTKGFKGLIFKKIWGEEDAFDIQQPLIVWQRRAALRAPCTSANQVEERWCNGILSASAPVAWAVPRAGRMFIALVNKQHVSKSKTIKMWLLSNPILY